MLTLEIHGKFIVWPDEFAVMMMKYYRDNGINFIVHRNCLHSGRVPEKGNSLMSRLLESAEIREYSFCCCPQLTGS